MIMSANELKNMLLWCIQGYNYYYSNAYDDNNNVVDERCYEMCRYTENLLCGIINNFPENERNNFVVATSKKTLPNTIRQMVNLVNNSEVFTNSQLLTEEKWNDIFSFIFKINDEAQFDEEYLDSVKEVLASGSIYMHKDKLEMLTGKFTPNNKSIYEEVQNKKSGDLARELQERVKKIMDNKFLPNEEKRNLLISLRNIYSYFECMKELYIEDDDYISYK